MKILVVIWFFSFNLFFGIYKGLTHFQKLIFIQKLFLKKIHVLGQM
jgi:hypothetical protein